MSVGHIILITVAILPLSQCVLFSSSASANSSLLVDVRLPDNVVPLSYKINLIPDMEGDNFTFSGKSEINISVKKSTGIITLHAKNLTIDEVIQVNCRLHDSPDEIHNFTVLNHSIDTETDFLKIYLQKELLADSNCNLTLNYNSINNDNNATTGFYEASYSEIGTIKKIAATHFEPTYARKAFPCWDEPALKAHFSISIKHKTKYRAFSNMHIMGNKTDLKDSTLVTTYFAQTPKMSTYLVAVVVGDFIPAVDNDNATFRFWTRRNIDYDREYVHRIGLKALDTLENYFNFSYEAQGFKKIDMVAIPITQSDGMENWGLVICQESKFVSPKKTHSILAKEWMVTIIVHELAHQWFGNLITASWWNYLWLNEGFATYIADIVIDKIEPMWKIKERNAIEHVSNVMIRDSDKGTYAIEDKRNGGKDIFGGTAAFLNYVKSPAILRMISYVLSEEKFQAALRHFVKRQAFKSITSKDLFLELSGGSYSLFEFMKNWVTQPGYPLITVTRDYESNKARITQSRFLHHINDTSEERYWIPLNFATEDKLNFNDTEVTHWFRPSKNAVEIDGLKKNQFVIFNKQKFALYRVNYDEKNWKLIARYLKTQNHNDIHVLNRVQLISDASSLAKLEKLPYNIVLSLMAYLEKETDYFVWEAVMSLINDIHILLKHTEFAKPFENYILKLTKSFFTHNQIGEYDENDHVMRLNRIYTLILACYMRTELCRLEQSKIVARWLKNPEEVTFSNDDNNWIIYNGLENDNQEAWDKLWEKNSPAQLLSALPYSSNVTVVEKYLLKIISDNSTTFKKFEICLMNCVYQPAITNATLNFAIQHYNEIILLDGYSDVKGNYIISLAKRLQTQYQRNKLMELFENTKHFSKDVINTALQFADKNIKYCNDRFNKRSSEFKQFFEDLTLEENRL